MYVLIAFISIATLYSGKMFGKTCDADDAKPLLQRLEDDDYDSVLEDSDRKLTEEDVAIL